MQKTAKTETKNIHCCLLLKDDFCNVTASYNGK